jgi:hypothetical protein
MDKVYEKVNLPLGSTIEEAVEILLSYQLKGNLAYTIFNGAVLYSDTVTINDAYIRILGMTKTEFDKRMK